MTVLIVGVVLLLLIAAVLLTVDDNAPPSYEDDYCDCPACNPLGPRSVHKEDFYDGFDM